MSEVILYRVHADALAEGSSCGDSEFKEVHLASDYSALLSHVELLEADLAWSENDSRQQSATIDILKESADVVLQSKLALLALLKQASQSLANHDIALKRKIDTETHAIEKQELAELLRIKAKAEQPAALQATATLLKQGVA